jgi:hypothetical protein
LLIGIGTGTVSQAANDNEVVPANKTQVSLLFGAYTLSPPNDATISSLGAFTLGFTYRFHPKFSAYGAYSNLFRTNLSSLVSGVDVGVQYCFWTCSAMKQKISDSALVVSWNPWGVQVGAGFSQRSFQVATQSVGFSGPYFRGEANYMLGDRFKLIGAAQYNIMINSSRSLSHVTIQAGLGFDFGENVYEAARRPQTTR